MIQTRVRRRDKVWALVRMARLPTLPGGLLAYALGACMARAQLGTLDLRLAAWGYLVTFVANLVASYADEYADADADALSRQTLVSGGSGVLPEGIVSPTWALGAASCCLALAALLTAGSAAAGLFSPPAAGIVVLGVTLGWFYSMPPLAMERHGLGELDNAFIGGLLMPLMGYTAQAQVFDARVVLGLAPAFLAVLYTLLGVHWADRRTDAVVGKRSLPVILGDRTPVLHAVLVILTYAAAFGLASRGIWPRRVAIAFGATLPVAAWSAHRFARQESATPSALLMGLSLVAMSVGWLIAT